jgi:hypothetical protein
MLIIFKSPASGDVIMFDKNGKEMLGVLGKDPQDAKGIVTVEQLPAAIAALKAAIEADKQRQKDAADETEGEAKPAAVGVSFFQRAVPLLELLVRSLKDEVPVTWGV